MSEIVSIVLAKALLVLLEALITKLVVHLIPRVPVRQWVLSFPIALRLLFAAHPDLLSPLLHIIHCVIATFLRQQAGLQRSQAHSGAVTLIQRFGSAANLNEHA